MCQPSTSWPSVGVPSGTATNTNMAPTTGFDPEVLGGDTCALGECCMNPCGFLVTRLVQYWNGSTQQQKGQSTHGQRREEHVPTFTTASEITYIVACYGGWSIIFLVIYPLISTSVVVSDWHKTIGYIVFALCVTSWMYAKRTSPGRITADTLHRYDNYAYDNILYSSDSNICPTLNIRKLARSKFDRYSGHHVPRFDHYCPVLHGTIGEENYRTFLTFLFWHASMCVYGAVIVGQLAYESVVSQNTPTMSSNPSIDSTLSLHRTPMFITLLAIVLAMTGAALVAFLCFHVYLISMGMTTNEYYKWKVIRSKHPTAISKMADEEQVATAQPEPCDSGSTRRSRRCRYKTNIYHLGIWQNFREVLYPRCLQTNILIPKKQM